MVAVCIGNENLSEVIAAHQFHNLLHTLCVEFVEDVVEQQDGDRRHGSLQ